jgi:IS605 OrfB family transposase
MKLMLQTQLLPDAAQAAQLKATVERFNEATDWLAGEAFARKTANKVLLQKLYYRELRERFGLSAQMAVRCIAQACEAYKRDKTKRPRFRKHAAMPFDPRLMSFKGVDRVSLLTLEGRVMVPMLMGAYQHTRFSAAKAQCDLIRRRDGRWFLLVTVDLPEGTPLPTSDFIGVDLGVENLATTTDDGEHYSGQAVDACRERYHRRRRTLQQAAAIRKKRGYRPKSIRRALRRTSGREQRFRRNTNHILSKRLVAKAKDSGCGLALENLEGIRMRTRFRRQQRARMGGWAFRELRAFVEYKAKLAGVPLVLVDPKHTSQQCSCCGHTERANRPSQSEFLCRACGYTAHADWNAARNIRARAAVMPPMVSERAAA